MLPDIADIVLSATASREIESTTVIQSLWSGYGEILRLTLNGGEYSTVILKHIKLPMAGAHPRGWNTDLSHQRKIQSYQVEAHWYQHYGKRCAKDCEVPSCLAVTARDNETILVLTDLDAAGYQERKSRVEIHDVKACLNWLASFHATFLNSKVDGLWECGTYWHLATRPDELAALNDATLRKAAPFIDQKLRQCRYQTLVHGDAKLANFCFRGDEEFDVLLPRVAAVDFQYVGQGCGMKDVAYFIGSCLDESSCEALERELLDYYFNVLATKVAQLQPDVDTFELEREWRALYPVAWADFHRFLKGWSPGHWKINSYSERITKRVIEQLMP